MAVPIVAATAVVKTKGPNMLQTPVKKTAFAGERARVATTVATPCAESVSPLKKFSTSAMKIPNRMTGSKMVMYGS